MDKIIMIQNNKRNEMFFGEKNNHQTIRAKKVNTVKAVKMSGGL